MKKPEKKVLRVARETLRYLEDQRLVQVRGGDGEASVNGQGAAFTCASCTCHT